MRAVLSNISKERGRDLAGLGLILTFAFFAFAACAHAKEPVIDQATEDLFQKSEAAFKGRDFKTSKELCEQVIERDPGHAAAINLIGRLLVQDREFVRAKKYFAMAHRIKPGSGTSFNLAEMDFLARDWLRAEEGFGLLLEREDAKEQIKALARFKLMIIALKRQDLKSLEMHRGFFEAAGMQQELDFHGVLLAVHDGKIDEKAARDLWKPLQRKHKGAAVYVDSLLEAYFIN